MKDNEILILMNGLNYFIKYIKYDNLKKTYKYRRNDGRQLLKRAIEKYKIPIYPLILDKWKNNIYDYKKIVIFDSGYHEDITKYIKRKNKNCKIILYFWNPIKEENYKALKDSNVDEFWTFDKNDAIKYNMHYNSQFYTQKVQLKRDELINDVLFLGRAKNRAKELLELERKLNSNNVKTNFFIIEDEKDCISYDEYLSFLSKSKCILDFNQAGQIGLSLRPMESLFFEKKLITNNEDIKNYDFYNPNNIFILGKDNIRDIKEFINKPYEKVQKNILNYYDFENWKNRFGE